MCEDTKFKNHQSRHVGRLAQGLRNLLTGPGPRSTSSPRRQVRLSLFSISWESVGVKAACSKSSPSQLFQQLEVPDLLEYAFERGGRDEKQDEDFRNAMAW